VPAGSLSRDWRARVVEAVDALAADMVNQLQTMVRQPSVSGSDDENAIQHGMAGQLDELGLETDLWPISLAELTAEPDFPGMEVHRREAWGLVGRLPGRGDGGDGRSLMLNAHVDVVPAGQLETWADGDPFSGRIDGDLMYGRGTCDMKGGLVAALFAVRALRSVDVPLLGDLLFASVQGEEDGGLGTYATLRRGWRADACVIPEPTGLDLVPANAGSLTFRISIDGHATHAARRTAGVSALEKLWPIHRALTELESRRNAVVDPLVQRWDIAYPLSLGTVHCGEWPSTVPDLLVAEGRHGVALDEPAADARRALESCVAEACASDPWLRDHPARVEWWGGVFEPGRLPEGSDLLDQMSQAHSVASGRAQQTWAAPYGSDLRLMTNLAGVPTVHYGPGDVALAHGPDEAVPLSEVVTCAKALAVLALNVCGVRD
jgi:acetylornithine deacetylase